MAKTTKTAAVPAGFKVSNTRDRKAQPMFLAFVDKAQGIFESRKGAVARDRTMEGLIAKLTSAEVLEGLTRVSRTPATPAKGAKVVRRTAPASAELESID